jgi:two-component system sensor histidine kinase DesK
MNISMREMLWSLNSGNDTLERFIDYTTLYAGNFLKKTKIVLHSECKGVAETAISTEQRRNLFLCLKEAINNAYKYSQASQLKLSFSQNADIFTMEISDNGKGIPEECQEGNGLGI